MARSELCFGTRLFEQHYAGAGSTIRLVSFMNTNPYESPETVGSAPQRTNVAKLVVRVLIGGGWAILYITTAAAYHWRPARILDSVVVDLFLLLLVAVRREDEAERRVLHLRLGPNIGVELQAIAVDIDVDVGKLTAIQRVG